jgi:hypothetical protein
MRRKANRPIPSTSSQVIGVCAALVGLAFSIVCAVAVMKGLITGRTYSVALIFGDSTTVSESSTSTTYWASMALFGVGFIGGLIVGIGVLREVVVDHKRKIEARRSQKDAAARESALHTGGSEQ